MIRYHSCYPIHRAGAYTHLLNGRDEEALRWARAFNPYDLYSKCEVEPNLAELKPYYEDLVAEFFPTKIKW
jgi:inositol oxygenase